MPSSTYKRNDDGTITFTVAKVGSFTLEAPTIGQMRELHRAVVAADEKLSAAEAGQKMSTIYAEDAPYGLWIIDAIAALTDATTLPTVDQLPAWAALPATPVEWLEHWRKVPLAHGDQPEATGTL